MRTNAIYDFDGFRLRGFVSATRQNPADCPDKAAVPPDTAGTAIWHYLCMDACSL
jgi:hypothetical protein